MSGYYKLNPQARETLYAVFRLEHDVEVTVFGDDGRDTTFKGKSGDFLVLGQEVHGDWVPIDAYTDQDIEDTFIPIGDDA